MICLLSILFQRRAAFGRAEYMSELKYPKLFEPITVAGTFFKNRIIMSATGHLDMHGNRETGYYETCETVAYYERMARGGAGMVTVGSLYVDKEMSDFGDYHLYMDDPHTLHGLYELSQAITRFGAVASAELLHSGLYANRFSGGPGYGPVEMEIDGRKIIAMDEAMIQRTIGKFADAAAFAKRAGFTMVTIHAGHGWLFSQFMNPALNTRTDKWGGESIENRARLTVEVCDAIRERVGKNFPIEVRISGSEVYEGGYGIEEGVKFARQLDGHCDMIHVSAGSHEVDEVFTVTHPSMFLEEGVNGKYAAEIAKVVEKSKVVTVGGFSDPALMEEYLESGKADFIAMARQMICDPDYPEKIRTGKEDDINKCMRCLSCFSHLQNYGKFLCAINPKTGHEYECKFTYPVADKKKVLIVGGGIGGMQAALTCAERGHEVILCEKSERLGGALRCEEKVPFKANLDRYLNKQAEKVQNHPSIEVHLNTEVTPELAKSFHADVLIAALGARPVVPTFLKGYDRENAMGAEEAYYHPEKTGQKLVILGGGLVGIELGIFLAGMGKEITVVELLPQLNDGGNHLHAKALRNEIRERHIDIHLNTRALEINEKGLLAEHDGKQLQFEADTVIYAVGQRPLHAEAAALYDCAPVYYTLGDCVAPKNITNATSSAFVVARSVGTMGK